MSEGLARNGRIAPRSRQGGPSIAVVGGGFGGVGAAVMLKRQGYEDVTVFEKGERVGGVWQHNTYPGAACDIPSHLYEYSFAPNSWSRRFSPGAEIRAYMQQPETVQKMAELGATAVAVDSEPFAAYIAAETARWKKVIEAANIKLE